MKKGASWTYDTPSSCILPLGITLVLVPQYNGHRRVAELKIAGRRVKQRARCFWSFLGP